MGWWFGRKSAPADAGPFVPAWLSSADQEVTVTQVTTGVRATTTIDAEGRGPSRKFLRRFDSANS